MSSLFSLIAIPLFIFVIVAVVIVSVIVSATRKKTGYGGVGPSGFHSTNTNDDYWMNQRHLESTGQNHGSDDSPSHHHNDGYSAGDLVGSDIGSAAMDFGSSDSGSSYDSGGSSDSGGGDSGGGSSD